MASRDYEEFIAALNAHRVRLLGFDDLMRSKQAAGRPQDKADLRALQRAKIKINRPKRARRGRKRRR